LSRSGGDVGSWVTEALMTDHLSTAELVRLCPLCGAQTFQVLRTPALALPRDGLADQMRRHAVAVRGSATLLTRLAGG
jgi:hypothetical protein